MTCTVPGCFAKTFRRNLCRNHFYLWSDAGPSKPRHRDPDVPAAGPVPTRKETSAASPVPPSMVCRCAAPIIMPVDSIFPFPGAMMCQRCGRPPIGSLSRKEPT